MINNTSDRGRRNALNIDYATVLVSSLSGSSAGTALSATRRAHLFLEAAAYIPHMTNMTAGYGRTTALNPIPTVALAPTVDARSAESSLCRSRRSRTFLRVAAYIPHMTNNTSCPHPSAAHTPGDTNVMRRKADSDVLIGFPRIPLRPRLHPAGAIRKRCATNEPALSSRPTRKYLVVPESLHPPITFRADVAAGIVQESLRRKALERLEQFRLRAPAPAQH